MTTVHTITAIPITTGKAKLKYQPPDVKRSIYSKYSAIAAKSQGTNMTGFGFLNHNGKAKAI